MQFLNAQSKKDFLKKIFKPPRTTIQPPLGSHQPAECTQLLWMDTVQSVQL